MKGGCFNPHINWVEGRQGRGACFAPSLPCPAQRMSAASKKRAFTLGSPLEQPIIQKANMPHSPGQTGGLSPLWPLLCGLQGL